MLKLVLFGLLIIPLGGCAWDREYYPYSRSEVDAINVETQCKLLARNLVQIARCGVRR
jgi:hypothetical protein